MAQWRCQVCGYEYNPEEYENMSFEDLPNNWQCPICGVDKTQFANM